MHQSTIQSVRRATVARRARRVLVSLAVIATIALSTAATADAAQWSPAYQPYDSTIGDCGVAVGPVLDQWNTYWHAYGGVEVNCDYNHSYLAATVREMWSPDDRNWYYVGQPASVSGHWINGWSDIIVTPTGLCGSGYWATRAWVTIGSSLYTRTSAPHWAQTGC